MSTTEVTVIVLGILVLSYLSGMLGLGSRSRRCRSSASS
jgi:hypothetical protein